MRGIWFLTVLLTIAACSSVADPTGNRNAARALLTQELESQPQIPTEKHAPLVACLLDKMTDAEVATFLAAPTRAAKELALNEVADQNGMMRCNLEIMQ